MLQVKGCGVDTWLSRRDDERIAIFNPIKSLSLSYQRHFLSIVTSDGFKLCKHISSMNIRYYFKAEIDGTNYVLVLFAKNK